jgi:hypothetical protein
MHAHGSGEAVYVDPRYLYHTIEIFEEELKESQLGIPCFFSVIVVCASLLREMNISWI